jgi:hypothetical protein
MPNLEYFLLCESIAVDQDTNRISLFNVLEDFEITPPNEAKERRTIVLGQFVAVALFNRAQDDGENEFEACLKIHATGQAEKEHKIGFRMERNRQRIIMRFIGMPPVGEDGVLRFELMLNGNHCATHTVHMKENTSTN